MSIHSPVHTDLSAFEHDDEFRAHMLYYLGQANTYIVSIFWQAFNNGQRRKVMRDSLANLIESQAKAYQKDITQPKPISDTHFLKSIHKGNIFDAYAVGFAMLLEALPKERLVHFKSKLSEHAIPIDINSFITLLNELREKRNYLTHWKPGAKQKFKEDKVLHGLGLLLLSKQHQHILGVIERAKKRLNKLNKNKQSKNIDFDPRAIRMCFSAARKQRAEASLFYYSKDRSKTNLSKADRKNRQDSMEVFFKKYREYYPDGCWPRYNYHQFKIRYYFFGKPNIDLITNMLALDQTDYHPHFQRDVEAVFETSNHISRILNVAIDRLAEADKGIKKDKKNAPRDLEKIVKQLTRLNQAKQTNQKAIDEKIAKQEHLQSTINMNVAIAGEMEIIRNGLAHNVPFFDIQKEPEGEKTLFLPTDILQSIFAAFFLPHVVAHLGPAKGQINDFYTQIFSLLNKQKYHWVFPVKNESTTEIDQAPPIVIRRWTEAKRAEYCNRNNWRIDRREHVKRVLAQWAEALFTAKAAAYDTSIKGVKLSTDLEKIATKVRKKLDI